MYLQTFGFSCWRGYFSLDILCFGFGGRMKGLLLIEIQDDYDDNGNYTGKEIYFDFLFIKMFTDIYRKNKERIKETLDEYRIDRYRQS